jgi:uncharacterized membrane protein
MFCYRCGVKIPGNASSCSACGETAHGHENKNTENSQGSQNFQNTERNYWGNDYTSSFDPNDIEANKGISLVSYILFFVPLLVVPNSRFARFHVNQGLIIFIISIAISVMQGIFRFGSWWGWGGWSFTLNPFSIIMNLLQLALLAAIIYGIVNAVNGKAVEIPLIGKFRLIT